MKKGRAATWFEDHVDGATGTSSCARGGINARCRTCPRSAGPVAILVDASVETAAAGDADFQILIIAKESPAGYQRKPRRLCYPVHGSQSAI